MDCLLRLFRTGDDLLQPGVDTGVGMIDGCAVHAFKWRELHEKAR